MPDLLTHSDEGMLRIAGLVPFSTVDWPGQLSAALFLQGCPWRCPYCHNAGILDMRAPGVVEWHEVENLLARRGGLLDGVVFSGGEALTQTGGPLEAAMQRVHEFGFKVGLHTAGIYPSRLKAVLNAGLVDWVGLDIKALPGQYQVATGSTAAAKRAEDSLAVLADYEASGARLPGFEWEVRLTLWPGLPGHEVPSSADLIAYAHDVAAWARDRGARRFALQRYRVPPGPDGITSPDQDTGPHWEEAEARSALDALGFKEVCVR